MMSTILQQTYLDSKLMETSALLKLKVPENRDEIDQLKIKNSPPNRSTDNAGWSFLKALSNIPSSPKETLEKENLYQHPLTKSTSSRLSEKSLELCTENLGCETGSFMTESNNFSFYSMGNSARKEQEKNHKEKEVEGYLYSNKKVKTCHEFPPPLTTMSGEVSIQVRIRRENGRLNIEAVETPIKESCFVADRSEGRLRLCILKDLDTKFDMSQGDNEENVAENEVEDGDIEQENKMINMKDDNDDDGGENNEEIMGKENVGSNYDMEVKEKVRRFGRCKECGHGSNKGLWEPLWVATS